MTGATGRPGRPGAHQGLVIASEIPDEVDAEELDDVWQSGHWAFCGSGAHDGSAQRPGVALSGWSQVDLERRAQAVGWGWDAERKVWLCPPCRAAGAPATLGEPGKPDSGGLDFETRGGTQIPRE